MLTAAQNLPSVQPPPRVLRADYRRMVVAVLTRTLVSPEGEAPEFEAPFFVDAELTLEEVAAFIECQDEAIAAAALIKSRMQRRGISFASPAPQLRKVT